MKIIVEFSKSQNAFHCSTEEQRVKSEDECRRRGINSDYKIIAEFYGLEEANDFINENYDLIKKCRMFKDGEGNLFAI